MSCSLVVRCVYQYEILAVEMKNPGKLALLSFNRAAAFLYHVMVSENDVLEARQQSCHFNWFAVKLSRIFSLLAVKFSI